MNIFSRKKSFFFALLVAFGLISAPAARSAIIEIQPLDFGEWAITNNTALNYITVQTNGTVSNSPSLINIIRPPQQGIYRVDGLPAFATINSINVTMVDPLQGGNQPLTMDSFQVIFTPVNGAGETTITLGATARTNGSGQPYDDAVYNGTLQLEINY